jgi:hypothetical protein
MSVEVKLDGVSRQECHTPKNADAIPQRNGIGKYMCGGFWPAAMF